MPYEFKIYLNLYIVFCKVNITIESVKKGLVVVQHSMPLIKIRSKKQKFHYPVPSLEDPKYKLYPQIEDRLLSYRLIIPLNTVNSTLQTIRDNENVYTKTSI